MPLEIVKKFNWIDIFVIILLFRICYISIRSGVAVEFFKFLGTLVAVFVSLHYYTVFSDYLGSRFVHKGMPLLFLDFLSFVILVIVSYFVFVSIRIVFHHLIKLEAVPNLNRAGGLVLGVARGFLLTGLITYMLVISSISYLKNSVEDSYLGGRFFKIAPATYSWLWDNIASKFMNAENLNSTILEVQEGFTQK